jgi:hypothetical protein
VIGRIPIDANTPLTPLQSPEAGDYALLRRVLDLSASTRTMQEYLQVVEVIHKPFDAGPHSLKSRRMRTYVVNHLSKQEVALADLYEITPEILQLSDCLKVSKRLLEIG